jgi:hypothetical protein
MRLWMIPYAFGAPDWKSTLKILRDWLTGKGPGGWREEPLPAPDPFVWQLVEAGLTCGRWEGR